ncbi:MAG: hypothetical protein ABI411_17640 [Tahibacter sp.]
MEFPAPVSSIEGIGRTRPKPSLGKRLGQFGAMYDANRRFGVRSGILLGRLFFAASVILMEADGAAEATAADGNKEVAVRACNALAARVDSISRDSAVFLRSFDAKEGGPIEEPSMATTAFVYDNALATIALVACNRDRQAERVGAALLAAVNSATGIDARLYNAYAAGAVKGTPQANGWWSKEQNRWLQDGYQMSTATGNVAWTMLAFLTLSDRTNDPRWCEGARKLGRWAIKNAHSTTGIGFNGGVYGFDGHLSALTWKSTEHNVDLAAAFTWLARCDSSGDWERYAIEARDFVGTQWEPADGHFLVGTMPDGTTPNRSTSALDIQFWALLISETPPQWRRSLAYAEHVHGVKDGFSFNSDRDGVWIEGTAQGALTYRVLGRGRDAARLLENLSNDFAPSGLLYATRQGELRTGLAVSPTSATDDFHYYHWPHVGATAWTALAAKGWNPFRSKSPPSP